MTRPFRAFISAVDVLNRQTQKGLECYGVAIDQAKYTPLEMIDAAIEEAADQLIYLCELRERMKTDDKTS